MKKHLLRAAQLVLALGLVLTLMLGAAGAAFASDIRGGIRSSSLKARSLTTI